MEIKLALEFVEMDPHVSFYCIKILPKEVARIPEKLLKSQNGLVWEFTSNVFIKARAGSLLGLDLSILFKQRQVIPIFIIFQKVTSA